MIQNSRQVPHTQTGQIDAVEPRDDLLPPHAYDPVGGIFGLKASATRSTRSPAVPVWTV